MALVRVAQQRLAGHQLALLEKPAVAQRGHQPDPEFAVVRERTPTVTRWLADIALVGAGVAEDEEIVVTGLEQLADGTRVRIAPPTVEATEEPRPVGAPPR